MTRRWTATVLAGLLLGGCHLPTEPESPKSFVSAPKLTPAPVRSPIPPTVTNPSSAAVAVEDAFAIVRRQGTAFPGSTGGTATPSLHVIVTFTDDAGVVGAIGFPITTLKSTSN